MGISLKEQFSCLGQVIYFPTSANLRRREWGQFLNSRGTDDLMQVRSNELQKMQDLTLSNMRI